MCRADMTDTSVNYDLLSMCKPPMDDWKTELQRLVGKYMPGKEVEMHDRLEQVVPLIRLRCEWTIGSLKEAKAHLVKMVVDMELDDVLMWISSLHFDPEVEIQLIEHVTAITEQKLFLQDDVWILELVHSV